MFGLLWDRKSPEATYKSIEEDVSHWILNWTRDTSRMRVLWSLWKHCIISALSPWKGSCHLFTFFPCLHHSGGDAPCIKKASSQFYLFWWVSFIESLTYDSLIKAQFLLHLIYFYVPCLCLVLTAFLFHALNLSILFFTFIFCLILACVS